MFVYTVYGLIIRSDVFIKELAKVSDFEKVDITIEHGIVPKHIENAVCDTVNVKFSRSEFYLYIHGVAHYYVTYGNKIMVELEENCNVVTVNTFLLGTCFGILLEQRKTVAIHGGAVVIDGKGVIITGNTGSGKSTLTYAFIKEGYNFLADDVSAIGKTLNGDIIIYPTFAQQKLCKDAIENMGGDLNRYALLDEERKKYLIPLNNSFRFESVPLNSIYEINVAQSQQASIEQLFGADKLRVVLKNIYRVEIINYVSFEPDYFKKCVEIARKILVFRINRPKDEFSVNYQMRLIKASLI